MIDEKGLGEAGAYFVDCRVNNLDEVQLVNSMRSLGEPLVEDSLRVLRTRDNPQKPNVQTSVRDLLELDELAMHEGPREMRLGASLILATYASLGEAPHKPANSSRELRRNTRVEALRVAAQEIMLKASRAHVEDQKDGRPYIEFASHIFSEGTEDAVDPEVLDILLDAAREPATEDEDSTYSVFRQPTIQLPRQEREKHVEEDSEPNILNAQTKAIIASKIESITGINEAIPDDTEIPYEELDINNQCFRVIKVFELIKSLGDTHNDALSVFTTEVIASDIEKLLTNYALGRRNKSIADKSSGQRIYFNKNVGSNARIRRTFISIAGNLDDSEATYILHFATSRTKEGQQEMFRIFGNPFS